MSLWSAEIEQRFLKKSVGTVSGFSCFAIELQFASSFFEVMMKSFVSAHLQDPSSCIACTNPVLSLRPSNAGIPSATSTYVSQKKCG